MEQVYLSENQVREIAGMVVPVWFSKGSSAALAERLLTLTLDNFQKYVRPDNLCLVVDGDQRSLKIAQRVQKSLSAGGTPFQLIYLDRNEGKHYAVTEGILHLMRNKEIEYFVVRDCDADHFITDFPNLVRSAHHIATHEKTDRVLVIGRRIDRHRPLGFRRGQMEELCNRVMLDAMNYRLAKRDRTQNTAHYSAYGDIPDFKSGYKLYSRSLARLIFKKNPPFLCVDPKDYWRYCAEPIPIVEAVLAGAILGEMNRTTFEAQPTTTFTESSATYMHVQTLAWAFCRLRIPLECAEQMFDNHIPRLLLDKEPTGKEQLASVKRDALKLYAKYLGQTYTHSPTIPRNRFF